MLSSELSILLTGRYVQVRRQLLVFSEFLKFHEKENQDDKITDLIWTFMRRGGFPSIHSVPYKEIDS